MANQDQLDPSRAVSPSGITGGRRIQQSSLTFEERTSEEQISGKQILRAHTSKRSFYKGQTLIRQTFKVLISNGRKHLGQLFAEQISKQQTFRAPILRRPTSAEPISSGRTCATQISKRPISKVLISYG
jgi:hypothetical protein